MDYSAQCINIVSTNPDCVFLAVEGDYKIELTDTCENLISNEEVQRIYLGTN